MNPTETGVKHSRSTKPMLPDTITIIRLAITVILLILAYKVNASQLISILMLVAALLTGLSDIAMTAVNAIIKKDYFNNACLILIAAVSAFCVGCYIEAIVFAVVFELCGVIEYYAIKLTRNSAASRIPENDDNFKQIKTALNRPESLENSYKNKVQPVISLVVKAAFAIAVLYAVLLPLISNMTYVMSIRRGAMLIAAVVPASMFASLPLCSAYGLCYSALYGVFTNKAEVLERAAGVKSVVFDKSYVITDGVPKISAIISPFLDKNSFLQSAAYTAYKSEQRIAAPILSAFNGTIQPEFIKDFNDIPGSGMEITIGGRSMLLGTLDLLELRGIVLDEKNIRSGYVLYLIIAGNYAGCIIFKENINPYAAKTVSDLSEIGVKSYLVAEDGREVSEKTANLLGITEYYPCCDTVKKLSAVKEIKENASETDRVMYVSSEHIEYHTDADIDVNVGGTGDTEDMQMSNIGIFGLPVALAAAKKVRQISAENLLLSAAVKLILIVLALTGNATLWFIALVDAAAGIFGILNISSIAKEETAENE